MRCHCTRKQAILLHIAGIGKRSDSRYIIGFLEMGTEFVQLLKLAITSNIPPSENNQIQSCCIVKIFLAFSMFSHMKYTSILRVFQNTVITFFLFISSCSKERVHIHRLFAHQLHVLQVT